MKVRMGRCQNCCCVVAEDGSPGTACAGTWSPGWNGQGLQSADNDAEYLFDGALDAAASPWRVSAYFTIRQPATTTWEVKLLGGVAACGGAAAEFVWGHDGDGEYFELHGSTTPADRTVLGPVGAGDRTYFMTMCWDGSRLSATASLVGSTPASAFAGTLVSNAFTPVGTRAGFATGTITGVTLAQVYGFTFEYQATATRTTCDECSPDHCCDGPIPATLLAEIGDLIGNYDLPTGVAWACAGDCTVANGSFYLAAVGNGKDADGYCLWEKVLFPLYVPCPDYPPGFPNPDALYFLTIRAFLGWEAGTRYVYVTAVASYLGFTVLVRSLRGAVATPCEDWTDWIELVPYYASWLGFGYWGVDLCGFGGSPVARIKAA